MNWKTGRAVGGGKKCGLTNSGLKGGEDYG